MVILVAILAKDKSRELPLFLECLFVLILLGPLLYLLWMLMGLTED